MSARVPFHFPFHPPANALQLPYPPGGFDSRGGSVLPLAVLLRLVGGLVALGGAAAALLYAAPRRQRRVTKDDLAAEAGGAAAGADAEYDASEEKKDDVESSYSSHSQGGGRRKGSRKHRHHHHPKAGSSAQGRHVPGLSAALNAPVEGDADAAGSTPQVLPRDPSWATAGRPTPEEEQEAEAAAKEQSSAPAAPATPTKAAAPAPAASSSDSADASLASTSTSAAAAAAASSSSSAAAAADPRYSTPSRRSTVPTDPEFSHIDSIARRERRSGGRKSTRGPARSPAASPAASPERVVYTSPSKTAAAAEEERRGVRSAEDAAPSGPPTRPFALGIIAPRSLAKYASLLEGGFNELLAKQQASRGAALAVPGAKDAALLKSVEVCMPEENESAAAFSARIRATKRFDVLLVQYHGSESEQPIAFVDYSDNDDVLRILLLHRPEEILLRHENHVYKDAQYNVLSLLREVDVVVLLGQAGRPAILRSFGADAHSANVCVVPHGFSELLSAEQLRKAKSLSPIAVVGSDTTYGDMRWVADLIQLRHVIAQRQAAAAAASGATPAKKRPSGGGKHGKGATLQPPAHQILLYAAGSFVSYIHPVSKEPVDELARLQLDCPDELVLITAQSLDAAPLVTDVPSLKKHLWSLSAGGSKVVVCRGTPSPRVAAMHAELFDFQVQLYRELFRDYAPKVEYSGSLHARPGAAIPVVFESEATEDVSVEGLKMITVHYYKDEEADGAPGASASASVAAAGGAGGASGASQSMPWYPRASHAPDFRDAADTMLRLLAQPAQYQSQRVASANEAGQLTFRHVAAQYASIIDRWTEIQWAAAEAQTKA